MHQLIPPLVLAIACVLSLRASAAMELVWKVEITTQPDPAFKREGADPSEKPEAARTAHHRWTVLLAGDYLKVDDETTSEIYDFAKRRVFTKLPEGFGYDSSLYAVVGFRHAELANRNMLDAVHSEAGLEKKKNPMPKTLNEHVMSLILDDGDPQLTRETRDGWTVWSWRDKELAAYGGESVPVDRRYREQFVRFLRYKTEGHPAILADLQELAVIPSNLRITLHDVGSTVTRSMQLISHSERADEPYAPSGDMIDPRDNALGKLLASCDKLTAGTNVAACKELLASSAMDAQNGRIFDAMLGYFEYGLASGDRSGTGIRDIKERLTQDGDCQALANALSANSKETTEAALRSFVALRERTKTRQHVLMIFEANTRHGLGDPSAAQKLLRTALSVAPHVTGAWKDLGDLYYEAYEVPDAWRCWDFARRICSKHWIFEPIEQLELRLVNDHPEYF